MRRRFVLALSVLAIAGAVFALTPAQASGAGANVINNSLCQVGAFGGVYQGTHFHAIKTKKGRINAGCQAKLISGVGVDKTTKVNFTGITPFGFVQCSGTLTPSGNGNFSCKG